MAKKKLIAITASDIHLHEWKQFNQDNRRLINGLDVLTQLRKIGIKQKVPILMPGDLFHNDTHLSNSLLSHVLPYCKKKFDSPKITLYGIDGNHDQCEQNGFDHHSPSYFETFSKIFKSFVSVNYRSIETKDFTVHGIPYITNNIGFEEYVNSIELTSGKPNILMIHTDLPKAKDTNGREIGTALNIPNNLHKLFGRFTLVLAGHIHKPQVMVKNVIMVGAPQQQRRTDKGNELGYWLIFDDGSYTFKPFDLYPEFIDLKPGEKAPNNDNFYSVIPKKKEKKEGTTIKFSATQKKGSLARRYMKENNIKGKDKFESLKKYLEDA
jgi:DNA repair exonuclease SbcCD nuclease subunit